MIDVGADGASIGSICPQGWTLPPNTGDGSYYNLLTTAYGISTGSTLLVAPFDFAYTGSYGYSSGELGSTSDGYYWSRTALSDTSAYSLYFFSGYINPQYNNLRGLGRAVRCDGKRMGSSGFIRQSANGIAVASTMTRL